ncbi:U6 snRNA phosphodiesterase isoform X3 [Rana temporaria]|nr:U6 snRNA phosphodiesterase isoform X3 [Rana temporaria]
MALVGNQYRRCSAKHQESPTYKLAGVKHSLYNPMLPTLRRMDMDSVGHKLNEEHSRSSTPCMPENFRNARFVTFEPAELRLPSLPVTDTGREVSRRYRSGSMEHIEIPGVTPEGRLSLTQAAADWSRCVSSCGEFQLRDLRRHVLGYSGYAVRYLNPTVTRSWKYCLRQTPSLDSTGQTPLPADTLNTFRTFGSSYRQPCPLPVPESVLNMFSDSTLYTDDPTRHGGRMRSFGHERGHWATYVYVPVRPKEEFSELLDDLLDVARRNGLRLTKMEEFHISQSQTVILRHHWIEPFVQSLRERLSSVNRFLCVAHRLKVYANQEKTRIPLSMSVWPGVWVIWWISCREQCGIICR